MVAIFQNGSGEFAVLIGQSMWLTDLISPSNPALNWSIFASFGHNNQGVG